MPGIAAALLDDVHDATECATVLSFETTGLDLDFLNELERNVCGRNTGLNAAGVLTFNEVGVLSVRGAVDLEAVAHQRLLTSARSELNDGLERTAFRNAIDNVRSDVGLNLRLGYVDDRSRGQNFDHLFFGANFQHEVDRRQLADFEVYALALQALEALGGSRNGVNAWRQVSETVIAARVSFSRLGTNQRRTGNLHYSLGDHGAGRVLYSALQAGRCFLPHRSLQQQHEAQQTQQYLYSIHDAPFWIGS